MPLIFGGEKKLTTVQIYACTNSAHTEKPFDTMLGNWLACNLSNNFLNNRGLKLYTYGCYGLFSINVTLQGYGFICLIFDKLHMKVWGYSWHPSELCI